MVVLVHLTLSPRGLWNMVSSSGTLILGTRSPGICRDQDATRIRAPGATRVDD